MTLLQKPQILKASDEEQQPGDIVSLKCVCKVLTLCRMCSKHSFILASVCLSFCLFIHVAEFSELPVLLAGEAAEMSKKQLTLTKLPN